METFLAFIISVYKGKFNNLKLMMDDAIKRQKGKWFKAANKYRENLELSWNDIKEMDRKTLKVLILKYDTDLWEKGIRESKVLNFYALEKKS